MAPPKANGSAEEHDTIKEMKESPRIPNRLILCFDGTGNCFQGNTQDTNIVKLYDKFDRDAPHQMHYYQPGIGTYTSDGAAVSSSWFGKLKSSFSKTIDEGLATSFESHVCAGYRFLMRYYGPGDRIYIFGFSRGAFTARFLARMVSEVGLLSMGNEELVPFAYKKYQEYEVGQYTTAIDKLPKEMSEQETKEFNEHKRQKTYLNNFKITFCRHDGSHKHGQEQGNEQHSTSKHNSTSKHDSTSKEDSTSKQEHEQCGIKPHFLGLFDTVSSIGTLDVPFTRTMKLPKVGGTAEHIRHAVAIDEFRVKFKVALLAQDIHDINGKEEDVKEVWFPGNHGDVGGGWSAKEDTKTEPPTEEVKNDPYQLSDIALRWMIEELDQLPGDNPEWNNRYKGFLRNRKHQEAIDAPIHNTMSRPDSPWHKVIMWWCMEWLPLIKRWEYYWDGTKGTWKYVTFPLNRGGGRDIPPDAKFHRSVLERMMKPEYKPINDVFMKDSAGNVKTDKKNDKLSMVALPDGFMHATSHHRQPTGEAEPLRRLKFKKEHGLGKDIYSIVRK